MVRDNADSSSRTPCAPRRERDVDRLKLESLPPRFGLSRAQAAIAQRRRILDGLAQAVADKGYHVTTTTDVVERAGVSRSLLDEHFGSKEDCFAAAYEDGAERLAEAVKTASRVEGGYAVRLSAGLRAGLEFLAARPSWASLLLLESPSAARLEHERMLARLARTLRTIRASGGKPVSEEAARLLAGGLVSHLSAQVLAGRAECLPESHDPLLAYLLTPSLPATSRPAGERRV